MKYLFSLYLIIASLGATAQKSSYAEAVANTMMTIWKDGTGADDKKPQRWSYDESVVLRGIEGLWYKTGDARYFKYIQRCLDVFVTKEGTINTYRMDEYNIDMIPLGRMLLLLYGVTGEEKYYKASTVLREQLKNHPRTKEGGFWHKKRYPYQMWLDGLYMGEPFYAEYAATFNEPEAFDDIANQFIWMEKHSRDAKTGLMYHAWDESKEQKWANKTTGVSPHFWARAMGWYGMAVVDVLEWFPANHPKRAALLDIVKRFAAAVQKTQDPKTGLWWDIMDMPGREKNYLEASASAMFVYAYAKGVRLGYLPASYTAVAKKAYDGMIKKFIETGSDGLVNFNGTVSVSGLGGDPYRDGSYEYYMSEKVVVNDPKGVGAFIQAANEMELMPTLSTGKGKKVVLDYYFNNEYKKNAAGQNTRFHYTWEDRANSGFSLFGNIFRQYGALTERLETAPSLAGGAARLKNADVYIIVDPDTDKETSKPNYVTAQDANAIYDWVKAGGILLLLTNDSGNAEFKNFNRIPEKFGMHFNEVSLNKVIGNQYEQGAFPITVQDAIFKTTKKIYIKEISTLQLSDPAKAHFKNSTNDVVMSVAKVGKGTVFAVGDPWFYNEYIDGRKLPAEYENFNAAKDLVKWLLMQSPAKK
jgi:unsaturated rhamnogalacturonyl hydrolase